MNIDLSKRLTVFDMVLCLLSVIIIIFETPAIAKTIGGEVVLSIIFVYILIILRPTARLNIENIKSIAFIFIYLFLIVFYKLSGFSDAEKSTYLKIIEFFFMFIMMYPLYARLEKKHIMVILSVIATSMGITMLYNIHLHNIWGLKYSMQLYTDSGVKGMIFTQYVSSILFASGACFVAFLEFKRYSVKALFLFLTLFLLYFNFTVAQRGIVLVFSMLMFPLLLFSRSSEKNRVLYVLIAAIIFACIMVVGYDVVLIKMAEIIGSTRLKSRIEAIVRLAQSADINQAGGTMAARFYLIKTSVDTFLASVTNFIFGVGEHRLNNNIIGNHSNFIDEFARYGIIGGVLVISTICLMLKYVKKEINIEKDSGLLRQFNVLLLIFVLRSLCGFVLEQSIAVQMFVTIPLIFKLIMICERADVRNDGTSFNEAQ